MRGEVEKSRQPFDPAFIQERLISAEGLAGLNEEARLVLYIMIKTGLRPSEVVNLRDGTIFLDTPIPYVRIAADGRRLKTEDSAREARCIEISANIHAQLNLYFDWEASRHTVLAFVHAAGLSPSQDALDELVDALYNAVTGDYPFDRPTYRWPDALTFDCMLKMRVATLPPTCGPDDLLKVILNPAIAEPVGATMPSRSCQA